MTRAAISVAVIVALSLCPYGAAWGQLVPGPSQDPLAGARVFGAKGCNRCHSINGLGGKVGPDLARIARPHSFFDLAADMWNHLGKMVPRMQQLGIPPPRLDDREVGDLVGFLYTLNYFDRPGDAAAGRKLFREKRCILCHQARGTGGVVGPDLDSLQQFASPIFIASAMWNHAPRMAEVMKEKGIERPRFTGQELRDLIAFLSPATAGAQEGPLYVLPGRPDTGRQLFTEKHCIECHSVGGTGGKVGPDLVELGVRRSPIEFAAAIWNKEPLMLAAMKSRSIKTPQLRPDEMADIVAFLYTVRYFGNAGTPLNGYAVLTQKGCLSCHAISSERGKPASDLTRLDGLDSPAAVLAALWNHALVMQADIKGKKNEWPQFRSQEMADLVALLQSLSQKKR
jgi:mono/diheme cytochrome c family protein